MKNYKPRVSAYTLAYQIIREDYVRNGCMPLRKDRVQRLLESTPGICFAAGTTIDEVMDTLSKWRLIFRGNPSGLEGEHIIPLDKEKS